MELRTDAQNNSMHRFFREVADTLRASGLDVRTTLKEDFELEWSEGLVKEILWRTAQKIVFGKISTKDLTTKEVTEVYDMVNRFLAKHGIHVVWPSIESQQNDEQTDMASSSSTSNISSSRRLLDDTIK